MLRIQKMDAGEFAAFVRDTRIRVVRRLGTWWIEIHPFFYRPLLPFDELPPTASQYPRLAWLGGVQHAVPDFAPANSTKRYFIFDHPQAYDLTELPHPRANKIRKGLKHFQWKPCTDVGRFITEAHPVYADFARRTGYLFKRDRMDPEGFARWARVLFAHSKVAVRGAYHDGKLHAVSVHYLVEDLFVNGMYFSDTESQRLQVHDFVLHCLREDAAETVARCIFMGPYTGVQGIDQAKVIRGCTLVTKRTHLYLNPFAACGLRMVRPSVYSRLVDDSPSIATKPARNATAVTAETIITPTLPALPGDRTTGGSTETHHTDVAP